MNVHYSILFGLKLDPEKRGYDKYNTAQRGTSSFKYHFKILIVKQACIIFRNVTIMWKSKIIIIIQKITKRVCSWGRERWDGQNGGRSDLTSLSDAV